MQNIIEVIDLTKEFKLFHNHKDRLLNIIPFVNKKFDRHRSLDEISFEVKKGEFVSIIGKNGSGKSTLLKILCGVLKPTSGSYNVQGKVVSLLELGTGFNLDLTGRDNVINSAQVMNFDLDFINTKIAQIESFADLQEYFDMPIKTYSSGMYVRLAMSLFLHLEPDVFIIDEALSVGDIFFQQKCFQKIEEMREKGVTFLFVSHDINTVMNMSDRVLLLQNSKQVYFGDKYEACKLYYDSDKKVDQGEGPSLQKSIVLKELENNVLAQRKQTVHRSGATIDYMQIMDERNNHTMHVKMTEKLRFIIGYSLEKTVNNPALSISFKNSKNVLITTVMYNLLKDKHVIEVEIPFMVEAGEYSFELTIGDKKVNEGQVIVEYKELGPVCVSFDYSQEESPFLGLVGLNTHARFL